MYPGPAHNRLLRQGCCARKKNMIKANNKYKETRWDLGHLVSNKACFSIPLIHYQSAILYAVKASTNPQNACFPFFSPRIMIPDSGNTIKGQNG